MKPRRHVYLQFKKRVKDGDSYYRAIDNTDGDRRHTLG